MSRKITNKHDLPDVFVQACKVDRHRVLGDISVTQLIDSPQIRMLKMRHKEELENDVSEMIWMLFGTAVHKVLEMAEIDKKEAMTLIDAAEVLEFRGYNKGATSIRKIIDKNFPSISDDVLLEQTVTMEMEDWVLSGTADRLVKSEKLIQDYKTATVYSYMNPETHKKWEMQLNIYAYMFSLIGIEIENLEVVGIFKDWSRMGVLRDSRYPKAPVARIVLERHSNEDVEAYIRERILLHQAAESGQIPECNSEDRWQTSDVYKIKKKGGKRSMKNFDNLADAEMYLKELEGKYPKAQEPYIETAPGENRRCADFCPVAEFCQQRKRELAEKQEHNKIG